MHKLKVSKNMFPQHTRKLARAVVDVLFIEHTVICENLGVIDYTRYDQPVKLYGY